MGKYFTVEGLSASDTARKLGIDNTPTGAAIENMNRLIDNVLDPIRKMFGRPIYVSSGYRSEDLNKAVGGSKNSHHIKGMAADINGGSPYNNKLLLELIKKSGVKYTQLINEKPDGSGCPRWVHVSYDPNDLRMQKMKIS